MNRKLSNPAFILAPLALLALAASLVSPARTQTAIGAIGWSANGTHLYNTNTGNVGIGTNTPAAKLDVSGTARMSGFQLGTSATPGDVLTANAAGTGTWQTPPPSGWTIAGWTMFNNNIGNVGIGILTPLDALSVNGDISLLGLAGYDNPGESAHLYMGDRNVSVRAVFGSGLRLSAYQAQDGLVLQETTGNVGIGTTAPGARLSVVGSASITGSVGIGTSSPTQKLSVIGDAFVQGTGGYDGAGDTARLYLGDTNASLRAVYGSGLRLSAFNAQDGLVLQEGTGNVGIGIATPTYKLDVDAGTAVSSARFVTNRVNGSGLEAFSYATTGTGYGVVGACLSNSTGYGLYSIGRTGATGTKSFRIDHPLDPENKYLMHYCAEGPEPQNVYNGTVTTDANGVAWVTLPDYFEAINKDPRIQLTVVDEGDGFAQAKVWRKVAENRFALKTSAPNVEVYWEVKAVRNDLWVQRYGAPVEADKPESERGTYQHPELYGQPSSKAIYGSSKRSGKSR